MKKETVDASLQKLKRNIAQGVPARFLDFSCVESIADQQFLISQFLSSDFTPSVIHTRSVLKALIQSLEDRQIELNDVTFEVLAKLFFNPSQELFDKRYYLPHSEEYITTEESVNYCQKGSTSHATWVASLYLIEYLYQNNLVKGKVVLELGSGCGLAGMAMKCLGARRVILTDYDDIVRQKLENAIKRNQMVDCDVRVCDWLNPTNMKPDYEIIFGSDLVYDPTVIPSLLSCIYHLLKPDQVCYLVCSERTESTFDDFCTLAKEMGFILEELDQISIDWYWMDISEFTQFRLMKLARL